MVRKLRMVSAAGDETLAEWETDTVSPARLEEIEREFNQKLARGYFAADITDGRDVLVKKFNPEADILLIPRVVGGSGDAVL